MNMQTLQNIRKYRFILEPPFFNNIGNGIALFDFILTFFIAWILESTILPNIQLSRTAYYLSLIPLGIIIHKLINQQTFLNTKIFNTDINIYKIIVIVIIYKLYLEYQPVN